MLDDPWVVWPIWLAAWLALGVITFAYLEHHFWGRLTLSRFVHETTKRFPLLTFATGLFLGLLIGGLGVHFWWHWCPDLGLGVGLFKE